MADRDKTIERLNRVLVHCHDLFDKVDSKGQTQLAEINQAAKDALELFENRAEDYVQWSKKIGVHTCSTCKHYSDNRKSNITACPIEKCFVLPKDGYCHNWFGGKDSE